MIETEESGLVGVLTLDSFEFVRSSDFRTVAWSLIPTLNSDPPVTETVKLLPILYNLRAFHFFFFKS
jgi:hypothetical protein